MDFERQPVGSSAVNRDASFFKLFIRFLGVYWRTFIIVLWPIVLLPILFLNGENEFDTDGKSYVSLSKHLFYFSNLVNYFFNFIRQSTRLST